MHPSGDGAQLFDVNINLYCMTRKDQTKQMSLSCNFWENLFWFFLSKVTNQCLKCVRD